MPHASSVVVGGGDGRSRPLGHLTGRLRPPLRLPRPICAAAFPGCCVCLSTLGAAVGVAAAGAVTAVRAPAARSHRSGPRCFHPIWQRRPRMHVCAPAPQHPARGTGAGAARRAAGSYPQRRTDHRRPHWPTASFLLALPSRPPLNAQGCSTPRADAPISSCCLYLCFSASSCGADPLSGSVSWRLWGAPSWPTQGKIVNVSFLALLFLVHPGYA